MEILQTSRTTKHKSIEKKEMEILKTSRSTNIDFLAPFLRLQPEGTHI